MNKSKSSKKSSSSSTSASTHDSSPPSSKNNSSPAAPKYNNSPAAAKQNSSSAASKYNNSPAAPKYNNSPAAAKQNSSSASSNNNSSTSAKDKNRLPSPLLSEFDYAGRLITRERPIIRKSNSLHENLVLPSNTNKYHHSTGSHQQDIYEEDATLSGEDANGLNKSFGVIRINDRHFREIYRLPTPPPETKRVFHRLRSPEPKLIERIYVHRPAQEIIENIVQVPPEKVRIITKEKYLRKYKPIIRTTVVHLTAEDEQQSANQQQQQQQQQQPTTYGYPQQVNPPPGGYTQSTVPSQAMFDSQQFYNPQPIQANCFSYEPSQIPLNYFPGYPQY